MSPPDTAPPLHPPPAAGDDFARRPDQAEAMAQGWNAIVNQWLDGAAGGLFYNAQSDESPGEAATDDAIWDAFPLAISRWVNAEDDRDTLRWRAADTLSPTVRYREVTEDGRLGDPIQSANRQQDEYCEWFVVREGNAIRRITFTSEAPEYWMYLANGTPEFLPEDNPHRNVFSGDLSLVLELYREHVDQSVTLEDITWPSDVAERIRTRDGSAWRQRPAGTYNPLNQWNTTRGAMHLTHPANTLGAEINLAADATVRRAGPDPNDPRALICCAGYGDGNRSSDPIIGAKVYEYANQGLSISLPDPVGLYIQSWNPDLFSGPNDESLENAWNPTRGDEDNQRVLRLVFEVPDGMDFTVDQARAGGVPIEWGGPVADAIKIHITAMAKDLGAGGGSDSRVCEASCCEHPEREGVFAVVDPGTDCGQVDWNVFAPGLPEAVEVVGAELPVPEGGGAPEEFVAPYYSRR
jgi:hypothetical protein